MKKFKGRTDWFELWLGDRRSIEHTMRKNMQSDLDAGYRPDGACITNQKADIAEYVAVTNGCLSCFVNWGEEKVNRWCYYDLLKRGAIEPIGV